MRLLYALSRPFIEQERPKENLPHTRAERILIINLQGIGDVLMATPLIHELARAGKQVDVLISAKNTSILEGNADVNRILTGKLITAKYDVVYLCFGAGPKSGYFFRLLRGRHKACHRYTLTNYRTAFGADIIIEPTPQLHRVYEHLKLLNVLGIRQPLNPRYHYAIPDRAEKEAQHICKDLKGKRLIGIHPGADKHNPIKRFPLDRYLDFVNSLPTSYHTLFFLGPDEEGLYEQIRDECTGNHTIIKESIAQAAALIKRCEVFIHNDSGLGHIASAVGTRTVTLFGPANYHRITPFGKDTILKPKTMKDPRELRMEEGQIDPKRGQFIKKLRLQDIFDM